MACLLSHKQSKNNSQHFLESIEAVDSNLFIKDRGLLEEALDQLEQETNQAYGVEGKHWLVDVARPDYIIPNELVFDQIDEKRKQLGLYDSQEAGTIDIDRQIDLTDIIFAEEEKGYPDLSLRYKFFKDGDTNLKTVLDKISNSNHVLAPLASKLLENSKGQENVKIVLDKIVPAGFEKFLAHYIPSTNEIHLFENSSYKNGDAIPILLHEIIHALTVSKLRKRENKELIDSFEELRLKAKEQLGNKFSYQTQNLDEFMAGILTNGSFINQLKEVKGTNKKYRNLWEELFNHILNLLGITQKDSIYNQAFAVASQIIESNNNHLFPQMEVQDMFQLSTENVLPKEIISELKDRLVEFTKKLKPDFKIEVLDDLLKSKGVNGIANIKEFKIQLQAGKEAALGEEVAHFFVELLDNNSDLKKRLLDEAPRTRLYKEVYKQYKEVYGNDTERLKRETAAKLISLYLSDKELFKHWSGSDQLVDNLIRWIKDFFKWIKGNKQLNSFVESADQMLNLNTSQLVLEQAYKAQEMYALGEFLDKINVLESLNDFRINKVDKLLINISNTILDYENYPGTPKEKRDFLFDERQNLKRDEFYQTSKLTTLGRELRDKISLIDKPIIFYTRMVVSPALETRLKQEFGNNFTIERTNVSEPIMDENGNIIKEGEEKNTVQDIINREIGLNPTVKLAVIDNSAAVKVENATFRRYSQRKAIYQRLEDRIEKERLKKEAVEYNQRFISELEKLDQGKVTKQVEEAFKIIHKEFKDIETTEAVLKNLGVDEEEVSQLFKDEYGNLKLPLKPAEQAVRFLKELDDFEKGMLQFLGTLEGVTGFFKERNETNYQTVRNLIKKGIENNDEKTLENAIQELAMITKMGNSWKEYTSKFRELIQDYPQTQTVQQLLSDLEGQIDQTKRIARELSKQALSNRLDREFEAYNLNIKGQIAEYDRLISEATDEKQKSIYQTRRDNLERSLKKPEDLISIFNGDIKDMDSITVWVKQLHESSDPLLGSVNRLLQKAFVEVEIETIQRAQEMGAKVNDLMRESGVTQKDIEENLISTQTFYTQEFSPETGKNEWVKKERLELLNQWQNLHERLEKKQVVDEAYNKWQEAKQNKSEDVETLKKDFLTKNKDFRKWETDNWNRPYIQEYYRRYDSLLQTEEDEDLFEEIKSIQSLKYGEIEDLTMKLQMETNSAGIKELNSRIEDLKRELKKLKRETNDDGTLKQGKDLQIAQMLQRKSEIDREIYEYSSDFQKFRNDFVTFINTIPGINDAVISTMISMTGDRENFSELYEYAKQNAPYQVVEWLDLHTIIRYSSEWYAARKVITDQIVEASNKLSELYDIDNTDLKKIWEDLFTLTSPLRDEDNILDGADATPQIQAKVLEYEKEIEKIKELARAEKEGKTSPEIKELKARLGELVRELHEIQLSTTTDTYSDEFVKQGQETGFFDVLKTVQIDHNSNIVSAINTDEFLKALNNNPDHPFVKWFFNNHLEKTTYGPEGQVEQTWVPTYIWMKKEPKNNSEILTLPSFKYSKRKVKDEYKNQKDNWNNWNPVTKEWLPLSNNEKYKNPAYQKLRNSSNSKEIALFKILKNITDFHLSTQENSIIRESKLGFALPYMRKMDLDTGYFKNILNNFTDKANKFEQGEGNFDETVKEPTIKDRIISWWNGFLDETTDEGELNNKAETQRFQRIAVPYTHHIEPEQVSKDILLSTIMFAASTSKANRMFKSLPTFNLIEEVLENPPKLDKKGRLVGNNSNRLRALQFSKEYHLYGVNKKYEVGQGLDNTFKYIRKLNTVGSLGFPFGFANTIKNNLQGRIQNMIGTRFADWSSPRAMRKAAANLNTNFISYMSQSEVPNDKRSLDFHIITYFNPELAHDIYQYTLTGSTKRVLKDRPLYLFNKAMEFSISVNLLYGHLYHTRVTNGKEQKELAEILEFKEGKLQPKPGWTVIKNGRVVDENYLLETKLAYKTVAEYTQGKIVDKTALTQSTIGQALSYFKNWLLPMLRRRFDKKRENYMIGENLEGYWRAFGRMTLIMMRDLKDAKMYWNSFTEEEKRNYITAAQETAFMFTSLVLLSLVFGFDANDPDKFKKLKDNSYAENLALLVLLGAKNETESLSAMPFFNIEQQAVPPILTEGSKWVKNPTIGFSIIDNSWKTMNYAYDLIANPETAYYQQNMPQYGIEKGDPKFLHYLLKVSQFDDFLNTTHPERKIQSMISMMKM